MSLFAYEIILIWGVGKDKYELEILIPSSSVRMQCCTLLTECLSVDRMYCFVFQGVQLLIC